MKDVSRELPSRKLMLCLESLERVFPRFNYWHNWPFPTGNAHKEAENRTKLGMHQSNFFSSDVDTNAGGLHAIPDNNLISLLI